MLMEFSLDVNNCRTNWMRKQAEMLKYAEDGAPAPELGTEAAEEATPLTDAQKIESVKGFLNAQDDKKKNELKTEWNTLATAQDPSMLNAYTGAAGGAGLGALLALARPKEKRNWATWLAALGLGGGAGFLGGGLWDANSRVNKAMPGMYDAHSSEIEQWLATQAKGVTLPEAPAAAPTEAPAAGSTK